MRMKIQWLMSFTRHGLVQSQSGQRDSEGEEKNEAQTSSSMSITRYSLGQAWLPLGHSWVQTLCLINENK